jgi:hypothetical protein
MTRQTTTRIAIYLIQLGAHAKKQTEETSSKIGRKKTPLIINFGKDSRTYKLQ